MIDRPQSVRSGEELPLHALQNYFHQHNLSKIIDIQQFPSGYSNLTYCLKTEEGDLVLRRAPFGASARGGHNMEREFLIAQGIYPFYKKIPRSILLCTDESIMGTPFYLMERITGIIIRKDNPEHSPELYKALSIESAVELANIHSIPPQALPHLGKPKGYVQRQISGWIARHQNAQTTNIDGMEELNQWLSKNIPTEQGNHIIHNDYKYDNLVLSPTDHKISAVLDWEMTTRGCPLMDLGASLGYWLEPQDAEELRSLPFCPTHMPGNLNRAEFVDTYAHARGILVPDPSFYLVYGVWRLIIILEQIYKRYVNGHTKDKRFQALGSAFPILIAHAMKLRAQSNLETRKN
jgi:aminoglycoside phosphotransferase (APT) family kinase protein